MVRWETTFTFRAKFNIHMNKTNTMESMNQVQRGPYCVFYHQYKRLHVETKLCPKNLKKVTAIFRFWS